MPRLMPCLDCGALTPKSRCPMHTSLFERAKREEEPWRFYYQTTAWTSVRRKALVRDGHRCTWTSEGRRCGTNSTTGFVSVHHMVKLRHVWEQHGRPLFRGDGWDAFVRSASRLDNLATLCERHHKIADNRQSNHPIAPHAVSQSRRRWRNTKRLSEKKRKIKATRDRRDRWASE